MVAASILFAIGPACAQFEKTPVAKLPHVVVSAERIALRVFDPKEGGVHVGRHFVRMPGGIMYQRSAPETSGEVEREFFRFAIQIKLAEREIWLKDAQKRRLMARSPHLSSAPKPLTAFFDDDTLSPGDVVVAAEGFRVFKGSQNFPYKAADFVPLERWQRNNGERRGLREMERESRRVRD
jgi:hypothetical protein